MSQAALKLPEESYNELEQLVKEIAEDKKTRGVDSKTTFGEVVTLLIREHREAQNIPLIHKDRLAQNSSSENTSPASYPATGQNTGLPEDGDISSSPSSHPSERDLT